MSKQILVFGIRTSFIPVVFGILFCHFSVLYEESDIIPDNNRMFFNGSLDRQYFLTKKDDKLNRVLKMSGPPLNVGHIVNVHQGHITEEVVVLRENKNEYTLIRKYPIGVRVVKFRVGVEFEETSICEENLQSVVLQDRDKLIHVQRRPFNRPTIVTTRWFTPDRLVVVIDIPQRNLTTRLVYRPSLSEDSRYQEVPRRSN